MLPKVEHPYQPELEGVKKEYYTSDEDTNSYEEFKKMLKDFIGDDCWAVTVDNEIVFSEYLENSKSIRAFIEESVIRDKILEDPHANLLVYLHRRKSNARIRIYMFYTCSWTINIDYVFSEKKFYISYSKSEL